MIQLKDYLMSDVLVRQSETCVTAQLHPLSHDRWELIINKKQYPTPPLIKYAPIELNLVTPDQKQCRTIRAQLISQDLEETGWTYRLKWTDAVE
jgi:hypothetical protein